MNFRVSVEAPDDLQLNRRIVRDAVEKLRSESSVIQDWQANVMPSHEKLVAPGAKMADWVVSGEGYVEENARKVLAAIV